MGMTVLDYKGFTIVPKAAPTRQGWMVKGKVYFLMFEVYAPDQARFPDAQSLFLSEIDACLAIENSLNANYSPDVQEAEQNQNFIKQALSLLGWTQQFLSQKLGVDQNTVSRWVRGKVPPPIWVGEYLSVMIELKKLNMKFNLG